MFYFLSTILSILVGATMAFGQTDYHNLDLNRRIAVAHPIGLGLSEPQARIPSYRIKNEGRERRVIQESAAASVCFQEMQVGNGPERDRWLNRYKNSSLCRTQLVQRRAFPKQASVSLTAAILLLFLVGTMGTAALLSAERMEPLKPWIGAVERTD